MTERDPIIRRPNPYASVGDLAILVGDQVAYPQLMRLLWERGIAVLHVSRLEDLPGIRTVGAPRVALVYGSDVNNTNHRTISEWCDTLQRGPLLVQLAESGEVVATVQQESGEEYDWTMELPRFIQLAQVRESRQGDGSSANR